VAYFSLFPLFRSTAASAAARFRTPLI